MLWLSFRLHTRSVFICKFIYSTSCFIFTFKYSCLPNTTTAALHFCNNYVKHVMVDSPDNIEEHTYKTF